MSGRRATLLAPALLLAAGVAAAQGEGQPNGGVELPPTELPGRLELHRPSYVLPLTWSDDAEGRADAELKFQISLRHRVGNTPVFLGYTQIAYWRWLDKDNSRPFREINFNPEIWYRFRPGRLEPDWLGLDLGFEHESNGESVERSRSWDRVYMRAFIDEGPWAGDLKIWWRRPVREKDSQTDPGGDDNPDILEYYGHHELSLAYTFAGGTRLTAMTRFAFSDERGAARLELATPTPTRNSWFYVQLFSGYGESLETFRDKRTRLGIGFALLR